LNNDDVTDVLKEKEAEFKAQLEKGTSQIKSKSKDSILDSTNDDYLDETRNIKASIESNIIDRKFISNENTTNNDSISKENTTNNQSIGKENTTNNQSKSKFRYVPIADGNKVLNIDLSSFIKNLDPSKPMILSTPTNIQTNQEILENLNYRHTSIQTILDTKLSLIKLIREQWSLESIKPSIQILTQNKNNAVLVDILRIVQCRPKLITLDIAVILQPLINELFFDIYSE
jgi:hypothetical protein